MPVIFTDIVAGVISMYPSVTANVTEAKLLLVFANNNGTKPIFVVPASVRVADAVPLNVKLASVYAALSIETS